MRLQLSLLLCFALGEARAEDLDVSARFDIYADQRITVLSPTTRVAWSKDGSHELEARYGIDAVSGATQAIHVDAVSSATEIAERRHQIDLSARAFLDRSWSIGGFYTLSVEPDSSTHAPGLSTWLELLDRAAELRLGYRVELGHVGLVGNSDFDERSLTHVVDAEWAHVLDADTRLSLLLTGEAALCGERIGCHASPYRFVPIFEPGADATQLAVRERDPDTRFRGAAALRLSRHFDPSVGVHATYRLYGDSWAVSGHTVDLALAKSLLEETLLLRLDGRFTWQSAASFYRARYEGPPLALPDYRTGDRELAGLVHGMVGARAEWRLAHLRLNLRLAHLWYRYPDFGPLPERDAWLFGGGLSGTF